MQKLARDLQLGDCFIIRYGSLVIENDVDGFEVFDPVGFVAHFGPVEDNLKPGTEFPVIYIQSFDPADGFCDEFFFNWSDSVEVTE